ncbi:MAG: hypothetical protein ACRDFX_04275 [Chloroflexota bacterium]
MVIEQIRYFIELERRDEVVAARQSITHLRRNNGMPPGHILLADCEPDEGPCVVWQCGYVDEAQLGLGESQLIGNEEYEAARQRLTELEPRVEIELYTAAGED